MIEIVFKKRIENDRLGVILKTLQKSDICVGEKRGGLLRNNTFSEFYEREATSRTSKNVFLSKQQILACILFTCLLAVNKRWIILRISCPLFLWL